MEHDTLLRAVERFSQTLEMAGMPRMAARVFAYVLAEDSDRYTAAQLAEGLHVSPAAISGAVRFLVDSQLLFREREPGNRSDLYRVYDDDVWRAIMSARIPLIDRFAVAIDDAVALLEVDTPGARRMVETREFFRFIQKEMWEVMDRWSEYRREQGLGQRVERSAQK
jgi:DNA-binding transcriptional regulator GbsR (MarR family)